MVKQAKGHSPETASVTFAGSGGAGVMTAGQMLLDAAAKSDMYGFMTRSMGPQIRGGEAAAFIRLSPREIVSVGNWFDVLVAFDWVSTERFKAEINLEERSLVLFDPEQGDAPDWITGSGARIVHLPFAEITAGIEGARPNMVALGGMRRAVRPSRGVRPFDGGKGVGEKGPRRAEGEFGNREGRVRFRFRPRVALSAGSGADLCEDGSEEPLEHQRQRSLRFGSFAGRGSVRGGLPDHAGDRNFGMVGAESGKGRRSLGSGRGRTGVHQHGDRRIVRRSPPH